MTDSTTRDKIEALRCLEIGMSFTPGDRDWLCDQLSMALDRVGALEAILICAECGHLRSEHEDNDSPCFGGRTPEMKPGEGEYCNCAAFASAEIDVDA